MNLKAQLETLKVSTRVTEDANKELIEVARRSEASVLRQRGYKGLSSDNWMADVLGELAKKVSNSLQDSVWPPGKYYKS